MCRTFTSTRWPLAIAILAALCIVAPPAAFGQTTCQASGSIPIFPLAGSSCATGLLAGQALDTTVTLTNTSTTTPIAAGVPVAAVWTGVITVTYPVGDTFVPVGATGCVVNDPGVASCTQGATPNIVLITSTAAGVSLAAGAANFPIATIRTTVGGPVAPGCHPVVISAATPLGTGLTTNDPACDPQVVGGAQGSATYFQVECLLPSDCPAGGVCAAPTCVENACGFAFEPVTTICRPSTGVCDAEESCPGDGPDCPADGFAASTTICRPAAGACDVAESCPGDSDVCPPDGFAASTTECRPSAGVCDVAESCPGDGPECPVDVFAASTTECRASAGVCDVAESCPGDGPDCPVDGFQPSTTVCSPELCQSCPGNSASCPTANLCAPEICRTPGFWGTHAGNEKLNSVDITFEVLNLDGPVTICGVPIQNTMLDNVNSAVEAICVQPRGDQRLQLARQLTAAALNCLVSGFLGDCSDDPLFGPMFTACNALCTADPSDKDAISACIAAIDCLNNGGHPGTDASGNFFCATGTCSDNSALCTESNKSNCADPDTATCNPSPNCHLEPLPSPFEPPGPAGSSNKCNEATKNSCTIFDCP